MKILLIQKILRAGIKSVAVIYSPESGGYRERLVFSNEENKDWSSQLRGCEDLEWVGKPIDLYREAPLLCDHIANGGKPLEYLRPWWADAAELITSHTA